MTLKAIESFIATVDPKRTTVVSFAEFIAVFGGEIAVPTKRPTTAAKSQRGAFVKWWLKNRSDDADLILLPEDIDDWSDFNIYSDLLVFEKDLGYLTSAVLVFLEAPGAIAELSAFSQIESLITRLVIVVKGEHHPRRSFISMGPIRNVEITRKHKSSVCVIPNVSLAKLNAHIPIVVDILDKKRSLTNQKSKFDAHNLQHQILLVLDLINLFSICHLSELCDVVMCFNGDIKVGRIEQILYLLERTKLIKNRRYGSVTYYAPDKYRKEYIDYTAKSGTSPFKRTTLKASAWEEIQRDKYRKYLPGMFKKGVPVK